MKKKLFLIHGRSFKPNKDNLERLWIEALQYGMARDFGERAEGRFGALDKEFVYFGNLSNKFLEERGKEYDEHEDLEHRREALRGLMKYKNAEMFFDKKNYYKSSSMFRGFKEFALDALAAPADFFGVADNAASMLAPDIAHYWNEETEFGSEVRASLTKRLRRSLAQNEDVMLIGHSLGTLIAYDVLWKFSYMSEHDEVRNKTLSHFVSLGSPLGNPTVQERLKGGRVKGPRRYPKNIRRWSNVAAQDDYICHDETVEDDFWRMRGGGTEIKDFRIYNLAIKDGVAHQHHGTGYLIHPVVAKLVHEWMNLGELADGVGGDTEA